MIPAALRTGITARASHKQEVWRRGPVYESHPLTGPHISVLHFNFEAICAKSKAFSTVFFIPDSGMIFSNTVFLTNSSSVRQIPSSLRVESMIICNSEKRTKIPLSSSRASLAPGASPETNARIAARMSLDRFPLSGFSSTKSSIIWTSSGPILRVTLISSVIHSPCHRACRVPSLQALDIPCKTEYLKVSGIVLLCPTDLYKKYHTAALFIRTHMIEV